MTVMLLRLRESLALALIALLPFHALLVTVLTKWIEGPGHAPMTEIALWKEGVLAALLLIASIEICWNEKRKKKKEKNQLFDLIDVLIFLLLSLSIVVSFFFLHSSFFFYLLGFRYDFIPLIAFFLLRRVPWSDLFLQRAMRVFMVVGGIVAAYGIASFFVPASFFTWLGYNDLHSLYLPDSPLAPFQQIGGTSIRRIQSVMSGPNQLGLWLLIPIAIAIEKIQGHKKQVVQIISKQPMSNWPLRFGSYLYLVFCILLLAALLLTFSRAAWIGAAIIIGMTFWPAVRSASRRKLISFISCVACLVIFAVLMFPAVILRVASSRGHIENPLKAIGTMIEHPLGLGLGTAGPASNRTSDACVMLEAGSDASWATDRPDLCVFVADTQVQPRDRDCRCPFLPENWYLQIGVEMGWVGMILYLALVVVVLRRLREVRSQKSEVSKAILPTAYCLLPTFLALSIAALFLHAWEDSAVAYTVWLLIATVLEPHIRRLKQ